ncbi:MAG TPA: peroxide stress protein YaaA [Gammaproteobacteria bacterium]|nr:peroxide stress protein YaaA [Gammaproteobacteria bacterium]
MLIVVSPAKKLDFESPLPTKRNTQPAFLDNSQMLIDQMRTYSALDIAEFMDVSMKIAELNFERFEQWEKPFTAKNARPAALAFKGDVYEGLNAQDFSSDDFSFLQKHLRILSGLYGYLKPLDLMQPYRLEMGRKVVTEHGKNLYEFWGERVTDALNKELTKQKNPTLINLASIEYFKVVKRKQLEANIITPQFKDWKNGQYKMIGFYAKKARGMMTRHITLNRIESAEDVKSFNADGYSYNETMSEGNNWVFTRKVA